MNLYKLFINLLSVPVTIYIAWIAIRNKDFRFLLQRLGFNYKNTQASTLWIHAASVGEVNAAKPFINRLSGNNNIILTTNTPSSAIRASTTLNDKMTHVYCPVDWQWAVGKFISTYKPSRLIIIETELWPNMFSQCRKKSVPVTIINGRLSEKTLNAANWVKKRYRECLEYVNAVLSRSDEDSNRFTALGSNPSTTKTVGNIKYYNQADNNNVHAFKSERPYVLAASTRDGEEKIIVNAWKNSQQTGHLLVIIPRHPQRLNEILEQLKQWNLNISIRSNNDTITYDTDIYIADTFGELLAFIKGAVFVIMGGSFVNKGGQNILEVAQANKLVLFGPHMDNFKDEAELFVSQQAGIQLKAADALPMAIDEFIGNNTLVQYYENNAKNLISEQQSILENYLQELKVIYPDLEC